MAGDWIKMRADLRTHPKVVRMASALKADRLLIVGGLHAVWSLFDAHSIDGRLDGYTLEALDDSIGLSGFGAAMRDVSWLAEEDGGLVTPRFDEHNGKSAKRRASETERKRTVREVSASNADEKRTREEKRREESSVAIATGGKPPDVVKDEIWAKGLPLLQTQFPDEAAVRPYLGKLCKDFGQLLVLQAVRDADLAKPLDVKSWLIARCQERRAQSGNKQTALEARNAAVVQQALKEARERKEAHG